MATTLIRNAAWVIAWDAARGRHVYRRDVDSRYRRPHRSSGVISRGQRISRSTAASLTVIPGLINMHSHPEHEPPIAASARSTACPTCT